MSQYNLDNFDDNRQRRKREEYRRKQRKKSERQKKLRQRRIIAVAVFAVIVILVIILISSCCRAVFGSDKKNQENLMTNSQIEATIPNGDAQASEPQEPFNGETSNVTATEVPQTIDVGGFIRPNIQDDGQSSGEMNNGLYVWNQKGFELFYGSESMARNYAQLINTASEKLGSEIKTYALIAPNHVEFGLPDRLKNTGDGSITESQLDYVRVAYESMNGNVTPVNAYNQLSQHCNEYIYFNSDHHWTGLGAYYAYTAFAQQAGLTPIALQDCQEMTIEGFNGSLSNMVDGLQSDTVAYWKFPYEVSNTIIDSDGDTIESDSCYYEGAESGSSTYGVFLYGDNPMEVIESQSPNAGNEKIAIVHESYGNAFVPYFTYNYSEVYSIDFRSWEGNLKEFCDQNGITNVIFINGVMSSATQIQLDSIESIL